MVSHNAKKQTAAINTHVFSSPKNMTLPKLRTYLSGFLKVVRTSTGAGRPTKRPLTRKNG